MSTLVIRLLLVRRMLRPPLVPDFHIRQVETPTTVVPVPRPLPQFVKVAARVDHVRVGVVATGIPVVARPVRRHVSSAHDVLADLVDAVA